MNVLALQGGGVLGYGQALLLTDLEARTGQSCSNLFGMIAGTSVGSINGAALAIGVSAKNLQSFYTKDAPLIFADSWINDAESVARPKYSAAPLEAALMTMLGDATLTDCKTGFIATSYDFATDRPVYFLSYEKSCADKDFIIIGRDSPVQLWQICRASASAQSYFQAYQLDSMVLMDGGNGGNNAPDGLLAIESARISSAPVNMLSLGSGDSKWEVNPADMIAPSKLRAGLETIKIVFSAGESDEVFKSRRNPGLASYTRLSPDLGDGIAIDDVNGVLDKMPAAIEKVIASDDYLTWVKKLSNVLATGDAS